MKKLITSILAAFMVASLTFGVDGTDVMENVTYGTGAGAGLETDGTGDRASGNTLIGAGTGGSDSTGSANTGVGYGALRGMTTGTGNVSIGYLSGQDHTTGSHDLYINNGFYPTSGIFGSFDTGFFGVNNTSPGVAWDVTGAITASGAITGTGVLIGGTAIQAQGNITVTGTVVTGTWSSDVTLGNGDEIKLPSSGTLTDLQYTGTVIAITAGYGTTAIGDLVYLNNNDSKLEKTDGNAAATAADVLVGVVVEAVAEDASCTILLNGVITVDAWNWGTIGSTLWVSGTAGAFTETILAVTNDIVRPVAYSLDDDTIYFHGENAYVTVE